MKHLCTRNFAPALIKIWRETCQVIRGSQVLASGSVRLAWRSFGGFAPSGFASGSWSTSNMRLGGRLLEFGPLVLEESLRILKHAMIAKQQRLDNMMSKVARSGRFRTLTNTEGCEYWAVCIEATDCYVHSEVFSIQMDSRFQSTDPGRQSRVFSCILLYPIVFFFTLLYSIVFYCIPVCSIVFYCSLLYSSVYYCILLYAIVFYCILLYSIVFYCILLCSIYSIVFYFIILYSILFYFILLYSIVFYCILFTTRVPNRNPLQTQGLPPRRITTREAPHKQSYDQGGSPTSRITTRAPTHKQNYDQGAGWLVGWRN